MRIAISTVTTKDIPLDRKELIQLLSKQGHQLFLFGKYSVSDLHRDYDNYAVRFVGLPFERDIKGIINELKSIASIKKALKTNGVDILISYGIRTFPVMVFAAKLAKVKKILCIVNGLGRLFVIRGLKGFLLRLISYPVLLITFLLSDCVLFQNVDSFRALQSRGLVFKHNYSFVNGSGVNTTVYPYCELKNKTVFLMVSRLTGPKGVNEFIRAARVIKADYPETTFNLVGPLENNSGVNIVELSRAVADGTVTMHGRVEDVKPFLKDCGVFIFPSYFPEGIPRCVLEAMAIGRPIITTNSIGCKETVIDGENGFKVPPRNTTALVEKIIWMINNSNRLEEMGRRSREICLQKFNINDVNNKIKATLGL